MSLKQRESCFAVIPARSGSKRIPGKNLRSLFGKPIIAYTIEAAIQSDLFECVVVSTDSQEIADVALRFGAEVPFLRDVSLSDDYTPVSDATIDALKRLDPGVNKFDFVAQLMPNCPLRTANDIIDSYRQFVGSSVGSQISVMRYGFQNPWWAMRRRENYELEPVFKEFITARSQDLPELFCPTGAVWWARAEVLRREGTYHVVNRTGWEIPWERGVDIDTEDDWGIAEVLLTIGQSRQVKDVC